MCIRLLAAAALLGSVSADSPADPQTAEPPTNSEAAEEEGIREDITEERATLWEKIEGFFGSMPKYVHVSLKRGTNYGLQEHFCVDKDLWSDDTVVSCDCCMDHLIGDPLSQSALVYKSSKEEAPAFERYEDGSTRQVGMVNVWSIGGRIPAVLCDRGRLVCHCEDPVRGWAEFEPACRRGHPCQPPEEVLEGVSVGYEAPVEEEDSSSNASMLEVVGVEGVQGVQGEAPPLTSCAIGRIPLGLAFCEDFSVEQCEKTYSRTKQGIHHLCAVDPKTFRHCGATLMTEEEARKRTEEARSWAIQNSYSPELDWKVLTVNFTTHVIEDPLPPADIFEAKVLERMDAQGTLEKLNE
ncbi:frmA [Symbiodinium natans]|uniref:FrmA protein n=1 Tax=Symbiodinium natans TaxID=878477 RepID=A0A812LG95_9DINO|nr:frmA [Symbiodinium natans]